MERYELLKDIGAGNFGVARLMRNKETKELVAMKYIPRGLKVRTPARPPDLCRCDPLKQGTRFSLRVARDSPPPKNF
jgi:hypothetical protein